MPQIEGAPFDPLQDNRYRTCVSIATKKACLLRVVKSDEEKKMRIPCLTEDLEIAKRDIRESGFCVLENALSPDQVAKMRSRLEAQASAEEQMLSLIHISEPTRPY